MKKRVGLIKRIFTFLLVVLMSINSFAAIVSDNDGSAFITKAEFDALKSSFQSQIDSYNQSLDSKIDGAIASYLAGIQLSSPLRVFVDNSKEYKFTNDMKKGYSFVGDSGLLNLTHTRISRVYGLTGVTVGAASYKSLDSGLSGAGGSSYSYFLLQVGEQNIGGYINEPNGKITLGSVASSDSENCDFTSSLSSSFWAFSISVGSEGAVFAPDLVGTDTTKYGRSRDIGTAIVNRWKTWYTDVGLSADTELAGKVVYKMFLKILAEFIKKDEEVTLYYRTSSGTRSVQVTGTHVLSSVAVPTIGYKNDSNVFNKEVSTGFGVGWGVNKRDGVNYLSNFLTKATIMNNYDFQEYSYKNVSSTTDQKSSTAWNETSTTAKTLRPTADWTKQTSGTKRALDYTGTSASTYRSFQATRLQQSNTGYWSDQHQLGKNTFLSTIKVFDESCELANSGDKSIANADGLKYNRIGYYLDSSGNLITKTDNYVNSGTITYQHLYWKSIDVAPSTIALDSITSMSNEITYLGGGIPVAASTTENAGSKVKLNYKIYKSDGTEVTSTDGNIVVKLFLSNKQFKDGDVATGALTFGTKTDTLSYTKKNGTWEQTFDMPANSKVWLNAYADKEKYLVSITNIEVR